MTKQKPLNFLEHNKKTIISLLTGVLLGAIVSLLLNKVTNNSCIEKETINNYICEIVGAEENMLGLRCLVK